MSAPYVKVEAAHERAAVAAKSPALYAAAPDLLAALERIVGEHADLGEVDLSNDERDALDQARAAIAKAKGKL